MSYLLSQYVQKVMNYSSQYGLEGSISYVASNLEGKTSTYPSLGDFSESYSLQTYGTWWPNPSCFLEKSFPPLHVPAVDFIDVKFTTAVHPLKIYIFKNFKECCISRVWGCLEGKFEWTLMWTGRYKPTALFCPAINYINKQINMLRIEFDQSSVFYYPNFDGILLVGIPEITIENFRIPQPWPKDLACSHPFLNDIMYDLITLCAKYISEVDINKALERKPYREIMPEVKRKTTNKVTTPGGYFSLLPAEIILHIMSLLDLKTLCVLSSTCKLMQEHAADPILYKSLSLKSCWHLVNNGTLKWFMKRCGQLQELDLSWCGNYGVLSENVFVDFIKACGSTLTVLLLSNCDFVNDWTLYYVAQCRSIQVLNLSNCAKIMDGSGIDGLRSLNLLYLNVSRTNISLLSLRSVMKQARFLRSLVIIDCPQLVGHLDDIATAALRHNHYLASFEAWKTKGMTSRGLRALSRLEFLQCVDLGWALSGYVTESLRELVFNCVNLNKLFLTALRTMTDQEVLILAEFGKNLEQLDLMGTINISPSSIEILLSNCKKLRLLDVSYCNQIRSVHVHQWELMYPDLNIKAVRPY